eukprot:c8622_g1_i2 orf=2-235(-)
MELLICFKKSLPHHCLFLSVKDHQTTKGSLCNVYQADLPDFCKSGLVPSVTMYVKDDISLKFPGDPLLSPPSIHYIIL